MKKMDNIEKIEVSNNIDYKSDISKNEIGFKLTLLGVIGYNYNPAELVDFISTIRQSNNENYKQE